MRNLFAKRIPFATTALLLMAFMFACSHDEPEQPEKPAGPEVPEWEEVVIDGDGELSTMTFCIGGDSVNVEGNGETMRGYNFVDGNGYMLEKNDVVTIEVSSSMRTTATKDYLVIETGDATEGGSGVELIRSVADRFYWKTSLEAVNIRAWSYGNTTNTADPDGKEYTLPTDQSSNYGELMYYAPSTSFAYTTYQSGIPLLLYHQLARVVIKLTHLKTGDLNVSEITIGDGSTSVIPTTAKFQKPNVGDKYGTWKEIGSQKGKITPKTEEANATYSAVLIPTTYAKNQKFFMIKTADNRLYSYVLSNDVTFEAGKQYTYNVSVKDLKEVSTLSIGDIAGYTYDGTAKEPTPTITDGVKTLTKDVDYTLSYSDNTNAGTATVTVTGKGGYYSGSQSKTFTINPKPVTLTFASATKTVDYVWNISTVTNALTKSDNAATVAFTSSNPSLVNVSGAGVISAGTNSGGTSISETVTITAQATGNYSGTATYTVTTKNFASFSYTGGMQSISLPTGTYKLEVWGAQGGTANGPTYTTRGGYGGYSYGNKSFTSSTILYVCVGGQGGAANKSQNGSGGYNGGGTSKGDNATAWGGGGGATHIGTQNAVLRNCSKSNVYIVAGGGGGGGSYTIAGHYGGTGGGTNGGAGVSSNNDAGGGGTQSAGGRSSSGTAGFGYGSTPATAGSGGGGGLYGGGSGYTYGSAGGGGSGYIGGVSGGSTSNGVREGNGQAKITFVSAN